MITLNGKTYRNLEEQVQENTSNIEAIRKSASFLGARIVAHVSDSADLPDPETYIGVLGDCYAVGDTLPYDIYSWIKDEDGGIDDWYLLGKWPVDGKKGDTGESGADGTDGTTWYLVQGVPSGTGANAGDIGLDVLTGNIYVYSGDGYWDLEGNIKGPKGDTGDRGPQGAQGPRGFQGNQGPAGPICKINVGEVTAEATQPGDPEAAVVITPDPTDTDAYTIDFAFRIPAGEQGLKGDKGDKGDTGAGISTWTTFTSESTAQNTSVSQDGITWESEATALYGPTDSVTVRTRDFVPITVDPSNSNYLKMEAVGVPGSPDKVQISLDVDAAAEAAGLMYTDDFNYELTHDATFIGEQQNIDTLQTQMTSVTDSITALTPKTAVRLINAQAIPSNARTYTFDLPTDGTTGSNQLKAFKRIMVIIKQTQVTPANKTSAFYAIGSGTNLLCALPAGQAFNTSIGGGRFIIYDLKIDEGIYDIDGYGSNTGASGPKYSANPNLLPYNSSVMSCTQLRFNIGTTGDAFPEDTTLTVWYIRK